MDQGLRSPLIDFFKRCGENRLHEMVRHLADGLLHVPSVPFLGAAIPVRDDIAHITDENGVMREIEQAGLLGSLRRGIEFVEGLAQLLLDASSPGAGVGASRSSSVRPSVMALS